MRWIWIDKFIEFEPGARAVAVKNVTRAEEHLHDQYPAYPVMPASLIVEGMAQTAGILVGQARQFAERVILAKIKRAAFDGVAVPGDTLTYDATLEHINEAGALTTGIVRLNDAHLAHIDLAFSHLSNQGAAELGIPQHNFVFTGEFKRVLATGYVDTSVSAGVSDD